MAASMARSVLMCAALAGLACCQAGCKMFQRGPLASHWSKDPPATASSLPSHGAQPSGDVAVISTPPAPENWTPAAAAPTQGGYPETATGYVGATPSNANGGGGYADQGDARGWGPQAAPAPSGEYAPQEGYYNPTYGQAGPPASGGYTPSGSPNPGSIGGAYDPTQGLSSPYANPPATPDAGTPYGPGSGYPTASPYTTTAPAPYASDSRYDAPAVTDRYSDRVPGGSGTPWNQGQYPSASSANAAGSDIQNSYPAYQPGNTGFAPAGTVPYESPSSGYPASGAGRGISPPPGSGSPGMVYPGSGPSEEPRYRPGTTSDYLPSRSGPTGTPERTRVADVRPASYSVPPAAADPGVGQPPSDDRYGTQADRYPPTYDEYRR